MNEKTRIVLADAAEDFRHMLADMFAQETDFAVVGQTGDGEELLELVRTLRPQVVVMDLVLSGLDGLGVLEQLDDALLADVKKKGAYLKEKISAMPGVKEVRGMGLMLGVALADQEGYSAKVSAMLE